MHKKWRGYFTVEASLVLPIVLFLYLLIILAALFLYCRCAISQDNFLLGMRAGRFTWGEDNYGEVIYGQEESIWRVDDYVKERLERKKEYYPFFPARESRFWVYGELVSVQGRQKGSKNTILKTIQKINPITIIREGRKK